MIDFDDNTRLPLVIDRRNPTRPIAYRPAPRRVGPDAIDVACMVAGALFFVCLIVAGCALLYVVAHVLKEAL